MSPILGLATWANAVILAFCVAGATVAGKWWFPWMAEKVGHAAARGFRVEITQTAVKAAEAFAAPRERAQDEAIGHIHDELQLIHALALDAVTAGEVTKARVSDLVVQVGGLQVSGPSVLAAHLEGQQLFQRQLIETLGALVGGRRTADIASLLGAVELPSDGIPTEDSGGS